ncbi:efflux RND transporter periplasmic adaptor subunit [Paraburkholderia caribensis]|uniref:efflux RND transporter periplasmic adaptor subunit n=1 Tax=Paraburkholderia caribensis TaxID=75105 RepID=UPI001CB56B00|nr:efflux RND transporter periplasmic adaptor subunit [Paraburkholderia caribensis]CAG9249508.1 RND family efflux transporter MFP subunit [Paraburkholderia caribensis]
MNTQTDEGIELEVDSVATFREKRRTRFQFGIVIGAVVLVAGVVWIFHSHTVGGASAGAEHPVPQVSVSKPLVRELDTRIGFLGQFSAVDHVEVRAQVGGTLTGIHFKDGDIVQKGQLLFTIDSLPYDIRLAEATAELEDAKARLVLADQELSRARELEQSSAGTVQNVEQRVSAKQGAQAAVDNAKARIRDAQFDVDHCRITAPFTGRIGSHLVSIGNLIAGSRAAASPTTLLATLVSLDPIHLDFDMSESDYQTFVGSRATLQGLPSNEIELSLGNDKKYGRRGVLDFIDNAIDRSSGTIHARATVRNTDFTLTPGEFARIRLVVARPVPTLLLPDAAVLPDQSQHVVMTVTPDGTVRPRQVETGDVRGGLRVIRSGLSANDSVIVDGLPYARPGSKVTTQVDTVRYTENQD